MAGTKREHVIRMALESLGGTLEAFYFTMGETDAIVIADVPDALAAAAVSLTVSASGAARCVTLPLILAGRDGPRRRAQDGLQGTRRRLITATRCAHTLAWVLSVAPA